MKLFLAPLLLLVGISSTILGARVERDLLPNYYHQSTYRPYVAPSNQYYHSPEGNAAILKMNSYRQTDGSYGYEYETSNGIRAEQTSTQNGDENVVRGSYSYVGPDGKTYTVNYIADRNGYRAYGDHLPTQPEQVAPLVHHPPQQQYHNNHYQHGGQKFVTITTPRPTYYTTTSNQFLVPASSYTTSPTYAAYPTDGTASHHHYVSPNNVVHIPAPHKYFLPPKRDYYSDERNYVSPHVVQPLETVQYSTPAPYITNTATPIYSYSSSSTPSPFIYHKK